jgi:phage repressor protein C with HTH and peptisase S24 domain
MQEGKQEFSPIKSRILKYLDLKGVTLYEFYKKSGVTRGVLSQANGISEENLAKFIAYAQDISPNWILTGKGEMTESVTNTPLGFTDFVEKPLVLESFDFTSIPMLDIPAAAGLPYHVGEARFLQDMPTIHWPGEVFKHGLHIAIQIAGDSMEPVLFSGEWVICKKLDDPKKQIRNGNIYVVVTTDGVVAKRLYSSNAEEGSITLQSDNPLYQPYQQPLNEVLQVYQAKGKISFNLNAIQNEVKNRLTNLEFKLDQIVSKLS